MPPVTLLIKPVSGNCNMRCRYCFYADITENRVMPSFGGMTLETLENVVRKALSQAEGACTFAFQGGEPTLAGLDFYRRYIEIVQANAPEGLQVYSAIQTNGILIDGGWAEFFSKNRFLVGLSLDGVKDVHDTYRLDAGGRGTYQRVTRAVQILRQHRVEFNVLTVITSEAARNAGKIYGFYKRNRLFYQQYIACLDPIGEARGQREFSLTPELYGRFLMDLFDLWYQDVSRGTPVSIRYFDNLVGMLRGCPPESCGMIGFCSRQYVVEADGGVYPCDFYVLDEYRIGNLNTDSFQDIERQRERLGFIRESRRVSAECLECPWQSLCRGGCRRDRDPATDGKLSLNYFCPAYRMFFEHAAERLARLAGRL